SIWSQLHLSTIDCNPIVPRWAEELSCPRNCPILSAPPAMLVPISVRSHIRPKRLDLAGKGEFRCRSPPGRQNNPSALSTLRRRVVATLASAWAIRKKGSIPTVWRPWLPEHLVVTEHQPAA